MVADPHVPTDLVVVSTMREADGLAMSSRNAYLGPEDRAAAVILRRALEAGRARFDSGRADDPAEVQAVVEAMRAVVQAEPRATFAYADVCHPDTFDPLPPLPPPPLLSLSPPAHPP